MQKEDGSIIKVGGDPMVKQILQMMMDVTLLSQLLMDLTPILQALLLQIGTSIPLISSLFSIQQVIYQMPISSTITLPQEIG